MEETRYAYIGICKCGSVVSVCVDSELVGRKDVAKFCSDTIKEGLVLDRIIIEDVRNRIASCKCEKAMGQWREILIKAGW